LRRSGADVVSSSMDFSSTIEFDENGVVADRIGLVLKGDVI
jgi:hypothetical protein